MSTPSVTATKRLRRGAAVALAALVACAHAPRKDSAPPAPARADAARMLVTTPDEFERSCREDILQARAAAERVASSAGAPAAIVLGTYDASLTTLTDASSRGNVARALHTDKRMREMGEACEQEAEVAITELSLDPRLDAALRALDTSTLDPAARYLVEKTLRDFRRAGVDRDEATRAKVKALRDELVRIGQEFGRNIKDDVRRISIDPAQLDGLPDDYRRAHPPGRDGQVTITTDYPDLIPFMTYAGSRAAREALWRTNRQRATPSNLDVLSRLLARRAELARLLGYPTWAAYATEDKMVGSDGAAATFIDRVAAASGARMQRDYAELQAALSGMVAPGTAAEPWDTAFVQEQVRRARYGVDAREVRAYFEYRRTRDGVLAIVARVLGVAFRPVPNAPVWHPDVEAYDVVDGERLLGRIYLDMHPREGKYKHLAVAPLASGVEGVRVPEAVLMNNLPRPGAEPALLEHSQVVGFLHELGHLLHHVLGSRGRFASQAAFATEWDFAEVPSQLMEEWAWDPDTLAGFARHVDTGQPIPRELVKRLKAADEFGRGLFVGQQSFLAALSLELHRRDPAGLDTTRVVADLQPRYTPFRHVDGTFMQASFGHLDGYSALYYTYMWSRVIAKDFFGEFERAGLGSEAAREIGARYRRAVLEPGSSRPAAELVRGFLGRPFAYDAFEAWLGRE